MVYSTIRSILIQDEEHPLSLITPRIFREDCRRDEYEMGNDWWAITQIAELRAILLSLMCLCSAVLGSEANIWTHMENIGLY